MSTEDLRKAFARAKQKEEEGILNQAVFNKMVTEDLAVMKKQIEPETLDTLRNQVAATTSTGLEQECRKDKIEMEVNHQLDQLLRKDAETRVLERLGTTAVKASKKTINERLDDLKKQFVTQKQMTGDDAGRVQYRLRYMQANLSILRQQAEKIRTSDLAFLTIDKNAINAYRSYALMWNQDCSALQALDQKFHELDQVWLSHELNNENEWLLWMRMIHSGTITPNAWFDKMNALLERFLREV